MVRNPFIINPDGITKINKDDIKIVKENIYGYVPNVPGTTYGVTYIGRPIKTKQNSEYLEDATDFIKLNYKCPKGTVDDSNKCNAEDESSESFSINNVAINKLLNIENPNIEHNIVFKGNNIIGHYTGENDSVDIPSDVKKDMSQNFGKYDVAHNHPSNLNTVLTPSGGDIKLAMERGGKNYVVTSKYIYKYSFDNKNTDINFPDKWRHWTKHPEQRNNLEKTSSDIDDKWTQISLNIKYLNKKFPENKNFETVEQRTEIAHKALKTFAKKIGMNYNRIPLKMKENSFYLADAFETIKLNYRCEENPPGSGNFKCDITKESDKQLDKTNKLRLKEIKTKIKEVEAKNQAIRDQMDKVPRDSPKWKDLQKQIDTDTPYKLETHAKILSYKHPDIPKEFEPILIESENIIKNLSEEDRKQLNQYVAGWGNASYQGLLAKWQGNIPEHPEEWVKAEIGKRYSFKDDKSYDPNDPLQVKEFNNSIEAINTRIDQIKKLDGILEKTKLPSDIVVKTGVSSTLLGINELEPGDEINIPTYLSTSRSDTIANGFALRKYSLDFKHYRETRYKDGLIEPKIPIVLEMHLKSGSRALALESFALESQGPDAEYVVGDKGIRGTGSQQEVLLARGTKCTVKAIENTTFRGKSIRKVIVDASN